MFSNEVRIKMLLSGKKDFEIAHQANIPVCDFSKIKNGIIQVTPQDRRLRAIASVLGLPPERCLRQNALEGLESTSPSASAR